MPIRRSGFVHLLDLSGSCVLALHAVTQARQAVTPEVAQVLRWFDQPHELADAAPALAAHLGAPEATIRSCIALLRDRGFLTDRPQDEELAGVTAELAATHARDPNEMLDRYRRARMEGAHPSWCVEAPQALAAPTPTRRLDLLLLGDCEVQMETDFLRREAAQRGIDLHVAASFAADTGLAAERRHDAVLVGALQARHAVILGDPDHHGGDPGMVYARSMAAMLKKLRLHTAAPILIDALPEPTVQPLGFADRGRHSHRNRFRAANRALEQLAEEHEDVHLIDVPAILGAVGSAGLVDDGSDSFSHFGSPGWLLQRPPSERAAVHDQFPDLEQLAQELGADPYRRETTMARAHVDALVTILGIGRKKCVITDLDGVLWPGVLAETGSPFAWSPEISGPHSYVGLYFGIHEALRTLARRGIVLACVSKNDDAAVRGLWHYDANYPHHRLLSPSHFATTRINWTDKAENIRSIAAELGFPLDAFVFIDDSARERERIRASLPEVTVLGENLFSLRRTLLTDPRLQTPRLTDEAQRRTELVGAQLQRARLRSETADEAAFLASLQIEAMVERLAPDTDAAVLERVREMMERTTQFNATGARFTQDQLRRLITQPQAGGVFILRMRDRLADHGLVGVAVVEGNEIRNVVMSCRVIGLGGERSLLAAVVQDAHASGRSLHAHIIPTDRNLPVRRLYADNGFSSVGDHRWVIGPLPSQASHSAHANEGQAARPLTSPDGQCSAPLLPHRDSTNSHPTDPRSRGHSEAHPETFHA